jgi:hypothetical protein
VVVLHPQERASKMNEIDFGQLTAILVRAHHTNHLCRPHRNDDLLQTKIIKGVYKKHLHGLLFKLGLLKVRRNTIVVTNNFEALPHLVSSVHDSSIAIDVDTTSKYYEFELIAEGNKAGDILELGSN